MDWSGFWGYLRAGRYSMMKKKVEIDVEGSIEDGDEIIVVAPFWGGGPACAAKRFAERMSSHRLHLVVTSNMSSPKVVPGFESVATINRKMNVDEAVQAIAARFQK
jgi:mannose/fructose-specific phosphotransferase system component IIA